MWSYAVLSMPMHGDGVVLFSLGLLLRTIAKFRVSGVSTGCLSAIGHHCRLLRNEVEAREERMDGRARTSESVVPAIYLRRFDLHALQEPRLCPSPQVTIVDDHQSISLSRDITPHAHHTTTTQTYTNHDGNGMVRDGKLW